MTVQSSTAPPGAAPAPQVVHVPADAGRAIWAAGDTYDFLLTGENTGGRFTVWHAHVPPGAGPPPHVHERQDEGYYVLEGELEVHTGGAAITARAGSAVFIPRGAVHAFRNRTDTPCRMLIWMSPAGFEEFFFTVGRPAIRGRPAPPPDEAELERTRRFAPTYGLRLASLTPTP